VMLSPLSVGSHVLHFRGTLDDPINFTLDITYHLTVVPGRHATIEDGEESLEGATEAPEVSKVTWGKVKTIYR